MTTEITGADAKARLTAAKALLEQVEADNARLEEFLTLLTDAAERGRSLGKYYREHWVVDQEDHLANRGDDDSLDMVCSEDAIWNAFIDNDNAWLNILRITADVVTKTHITEGDCGDSCG